MKRISLIITMILLTTLGALSCNKEQDGGPEEGGGCGADPSPVTGIKLVTSKQSSAAVTTDTSTNKKFPCKDTVAEWNKIKDKLQAGKFIRERIDTEYNNYDFYRISISSSEEYTKYKEVLSQFTKNMEYQVTSVYKDEELNNVCKKIMPPQRNCINCIDDVLAINITNYIEREQTGSIRTKCHWPSYCRVSLTVCGSGDTFVFSSMGRESLATISEILDPECIAGLSIQDGAIIFPKPIVKCIIKDKIIDQTIEYESVLGEDRIIRLNLRSLCENDPLNPDKNTPHPQEENNNEDNDNDNDNQEVVENNPEQPENGISTYTKLKLQLNQSCYDPKIGRPDPSNYVPRSTEHFLITPLGPSCAHFTCTLE